MPLTNLYKRIAVLESFDIQKETIDILNENSVYLVELLKSQLSRGKDGKKENVTVFGRDHYSRSTEFNKTVHGSGLGKETRWITNYMTGRFYSSIDMYASGRTFLFDSSVPYFAEILLQSGDQIMELDSTSLRRFSDEILIPQLQERYKLRSNGI